MEQIKPNEKRAKAAIVLICVVLVMEVVSLISGYFQYDLLQTAAKVGEISPEVAEANDLRESFIGLLYTIAFVVSVVTFLRWFVRAYHNLQVLANNLVYNEKQALWAWFIPIVSLFRPYQITKELYAETKKLLAKNGSKIPEKVSADNYLSLWWGLWIVNNILGQFVLRFSMKAKSMDELISLSLAGIAANIIGIPLCLVAAKIIKEYSVMGALLEKMKVMDNNEFLT